MIISSIVAVATNRVIGKDNQLIWRLPNDMKFFKETTDGHCIITGRKNYESIPEKYRPLPNRTNIVITNQIGYSAPGAIVSNSINEAIEIARKNGETEVFIIGGSEIYKQTMDIVDRLYITEVHNSFEGDVHFPNLDKSQWVETSRRLMKSDDKHKHDYSFCVLDKVIVS